MLTVRDVERKIDFIEKAIEGFDEILRDEDLIAFRSKMLSTGVNVGATIINASYTLKNLKIDLHNIVQKTEVSASHLANTLTSK